MAVSATAAVAGIALAPAASASAATASPRPPISRTVAVPDVGGCSYFTDSETYVEYYCGTPPGQFRTALKCIGLGKNPYWVYGPWRYAGGGITSYARCASGDFVDYWIVQVQ